VVSLLTLAAAVLVLAALYTLRVNPEIRLYCKAVALKRQWSRSLSSGGQQKFIVAGGSSAAFSVDAEGLLLQHDLRLVNFGLHAGMGPLFLLAVAAEEAHSGDTLVVALEPGLLTAPFDSPDLAAQMGLALGEPSLIHASRLTGDRIRWVEDVISLRPGAYHTFTLLGKVMLRKPLYRYSISAFHPGGWQEARDFREFPTPVPGVVRLSPDAVRLLDALAKWGEVEHVKVVYSLPWCYTPAASCEEFKRARAAFLASVACHVRVLKDTTLGVDPVREHFADTEWHLAGNGVRLRSDALAEELIRQEYWKPEELQARYVGRDLTIPAKPVPRER